jgi:flagellar biosynthesis protein FlhG
VSGRKLGRGLSQVSHVFLSGVERKEREAALPDESMDAALWMPDAGLVSITSGEGVRGKTLLAANLGFGLYKKGHRVAVVNADRGKPDAVDIASAGIGGTGDVSAGDGPSGGFTSLDLLSGGEGAGGDGIGSRVLKELEAASRQTQFVIVDTCPTGGASDLVWRLARLVVVIAEPDTVKMRASYAAIKRVHSVSPDGRMGLVVNMARGHDEAEQCFRKISGVCRRFLKINLRNYGHIVFSDRVAEVCERAEPLILAYPGSRAARCVNSILRLIVMDESAIAKRRREVRVKECALKGGD